MGDGLVESEPTDRRERQADARAAAADRREHEHDIREGVLDSWERELVARAIELELFDEADAAVLERARDERVEARRRRRAAAEARHDASVARAVRRARHDDPSDHAGTPADAGVDRAIERLTALVDSPGVLGPTLSALLAIAVDVLPDAAAATACFTVEGRLQQAASTARWAAELDAAQLRAGAGPIVDAVESGTVVVSPNLADDARWDLAAAVGADADRGALSAPIAAAGPSGALTVYTAPGARFVGRADLMAAMLSAHVSLAVRRNLERFAHEAQSEAWVRALESRDLIGQAKGILMEQLGLSADAAFDVLRTTSQRRNVKVREIAEHVARHRQLP